MSSNGFTISQALFTRASDDGGAGQEACGDRETRAAVSAGPANGEVAADDVAFEVIRDEPPVALVPGNFADDPESTPPDSQADADVADDVCVAAFIARPMRKRRADKSWWTPVILSVTCHVAMAAAVWKFGPAIQWPDFAIRSGVGGSIGAGASDDIPAQELSRTTLPKTDLPDPPPAAKIESADLLDDAAPTGVAQSAPSVLRDSIAEPSDAIAIGHSGWSPDISPAPQHVSAGVANGTPTGAPAGAATGQAAEENHVAPPSSGTGGGGDGLAMTGLSIQAYNDPPEYPEEARRKRWQGTVKLQMIVNAAGHVQDVKVVQSSGYALLDESAVRKFSTYVLSPYRENGVAMDVQITTPVVFQLRDRSR